MIDREQRRIGGSGEELGQRPRKPGAETSDDSHEREPKGFSMPLVPHAGDLNVQPRQRRVVYEGLAKLHAGGSVRDLLGDFAIPESELRETLRKLDRAGLVRRTRGIWCAVPLDTAESSSGLPESGSGIPANG